MNMGHRIDGMAVLERSNGERELLSTFGGILYPAFCVWFSRISKPGFGTSLG